MSAWSAFNAVAALVVGAAGDCRVSEIAQSTHG